MVDCGSPMNIFSPFFAVARSKSLFRTVWDARFNGQTTLCVRCGLPVSHWNSSFLVSSTKMNAVYSGQVIYCFTRTLGEAEFMRRDNASHRNCSRNNHAKQLCRRYGLSVNSRIIIIGQSIKWPVGGTRCKYLNLFLCFLIFVFTKRFLSWPCDISYRASGTIRIRISFWRSRAVPLFTHSWIENKKQKQKKESPNNSAVWVVAIGSLTKQKIGLCIRYRLECNSFGLCVDAVRVVVALSIFFASFSISVGRRRWPGGREEWVRPANEFYCLESHREFIYTGRHSNPNKR